MSVSSIMLVCLLTETKPFVDKLFEALTTKEYLKADAPLEEDKPGGSAPEPPPESGPSSNQAEVTKDDGQKKGSLSVVPSALLNEPQENKEEKTAAPPTSGPSSSSSRLGRDRRDDDRDKNRRKRGRDRRDTRSRSGERGPPISKRSRSPRLDRDRERDRIRHRPGRKSPPPRRYERDWDRRRSRSPLGGRRSVSPRNHRSRSPPPRYRRPFNNSRSRSRSPRQSRSRSPHGPKSGSDKDKKDSLLPIPDADLTKDLDKPLVQSVVVRPDGVPPPGRGRCRDFDEKGLCMKGELCPFDHGNDPVVLEDIVVPSAGPGYGAGGRPLVPPGAPGYTPPIGVRPPMIGEYYPDSPALDPAPWGPGAPPFRPRHMPFDGMPRGRGGLLLRPSMGPYPVPGGQRQLISVPVVGGGVPPQPGVPVMGPVPPMPQMLPPNLRGGLGRGHHHHRGRGGFDHGRLGAKPPRHYTNCSLEVRKIPREQNTIMDLNSHFLRFGKIINIQINHDNDPEAALVTFSSPAEAQLAYRSTEAVLNNRFIRVFWHNKEKENEDETDFPPGAAGGPPRISVKDRLGGQAPEPMEHEKILISGNNLTKTVYNNAALTKKLETQDKLQVSVIFCQQYLLSYVRIYSLNVFVLQSNESIKRSQEMLAAQVTLKNLQDQKKAETLKMSNDLRKRQQTMMEEQIVQQKKLIAKLEGGNIPAKEKDEALKILKMLSENVQKLKKDLDGSAPNTSPKKQTAPPVIVAATAGLNPRTKEETQKEMLDAELDLINKEQQGEDTIDLQNRLQELRQKAKSMGLIGRGGGVIRGRGGFRGVIRGFGRGRGMIRG